MNIKKLPFYLFLFLLISGFVAYGQQGRQVKGKFFNIEQRKVFIENKGQFQPPQGQNNAVLYAYDGGQSKIYFTSKGLIYSFNKISWKKEPGEDDRNSIGEEEENKKPDIENDLVTMEWLNANNNPEIIVEDKVPDYFSYSAKKNGGLKNINHINGYQKLIYKNLYPGIDVEYVFHKDKGIEYSLLLHRGADISKVQMKYSDNHLLNLSGSNVHISTLFGNIIDHAPSTFYSGNKEESIKSKFVILNNNTIGFDLGNYDKSKEVIIDPWTITPSFPNSNKIWNCQTDTGGNVYLYGGDSPLLLRKYTSAGVLTWTYRTTWDSSSYWLGTLITSRAGVSYISSGANGEISEINTAGGLVWYNNPNGLLLPDYEYWHMALNCDQTQLVVSGTILPTLLPTGFTGEVFNIDLTNGSIASSVTIGYEYGLFNINEGRSICSSPNGNYYFLTLDSIGSVSPSLAVGWKNVSTYNFSYGSPSYTVTGNMGQNAIRATQSYIYTQNGTNVHQRDITNGNILLTATIPGGTSNNALGSYSPGNSGLDIDSCGNVYVGSSNQVVEYDASLNQLNTATTPAAVYDVAVNNNSEVIACGDGFAMSIAFSACNPPPLICSVCNPPSLTSSYAGVACFGSANGSATVTPSGGNSPYTYSWSPVAGSTATITGLSAGTYSCSVSDSTGCLSLTSIIITQPTVVSATFTRTQDSCYGSVNGSATATTSGGTSPYTYSWSPTGGTNITATGLSAGTYSVAITDNHGCITVDTVIITMPPKINISLSGNDSVCAGDSATITATGGGTYLWSNGATTSVLNIIPSASGTYTLGVTNNGCRKDTTFNIYVKASPTVTISPDTAICMGNSVTLNVSGGGTYLWSNGGTTSIITVSPSSSITYTAGVTLGGCTKDTEVMVTVSSTQTLAITPSLSSCKGTPDTITVTGTGPFAWSNGSTTSTIIVNPDSTQVYSVTAGAVGCSAFASDTVTVVPGPKVTISPDTAICSGNSVTLTVSGGGTYLWSNSGASTSSSITVTPDSTITYTAAVSSGGCTKDTTVTITVSGNQTITITPSRTLCVGTIDTLSVTGTGPYLWNNGATTNMIIIHPDTSGIYSVTVGPPGCSSTAKDTIKVKALPEVTLQGLPRICSGENTTLVATGGGTYFWTPGGQTGSTIIVSPDTTTTYTLVVTRSGCSKDTTMKVTVFPTPTPAVNGPFTICRGETVTLNASGGDFYSWTPPTSLSDSAISDPNADPRSTTIYTVIVADSSGCNASDSIIVIVRNGASGYVCCSDTISPGGSKNLTITGASTGSTFNWSPSGSLSCSTCADPTSTPSVTTMYTVTITDTNGCVSIDSVLIVIETPPGCGTLFVPNAFSPNESVNNILYVRGDCIKTIQFAIYDRWGNQVFISNDINDGWNGNYKNSPMDMGTYVYYLNVTLIDGTAIDRKGNVTLVR